MKHRPSEGAPLAHGSGEGILDERGAHVVGDLPSGKFPRTQVDHCRQVQVAAIR
jgi:hypothetical protein